MEKSERLLRLGLSKLNGIGHAGFQHILKEFGSIRALVNASSQQIYSYFGQKIGTEILRWCDEYDAYKTQHELEDKGIDFIAFGEEKYPTLLKEIYDPPSVIYYIGNYKKEAFEKSISVVGTRRMTILGKEITTKIVGELARAGVTIVSGMAFGIDKASHEAALEMGGYTVAVLGGPVDRATPMGNFSTYKRIVKTGLVVSECPPGFGAEKWSFPRRNRIISGITPATLVTEAPARSGALITAYSALEQNREVFAVPWSLTHKTGEGCNNLISRSNAKLVCSAQDILEEMGISIVDFGKIENEGSLKHSEVENEIVYVLGSGEAQIDELLDKLGYSVSIISSAISELEIKGIVTRKEDGGFRLTYK